MSPHENRKTFKILYKLILCLRITSIVNIFQKNLRPGGSVGAGVVGGSTGHASLGSKSHVSEAKNSN